MVLNVVGEFLLPPQPQTFVTDPVRFTRNRAYKVLIDATPEIPNNIFSFIRVRPIVYTNRGQFNYYHEHFDIDIPATPTIILLPFSALYRGFVEVSLEIERLNYRYFSADEGNVKCQVWFETVNVRTWLN